MSSTVILCLFLAMFSSIHLFVHKVEKRFSGKNAHCYVALFVFYVVRVKSGQLVDRSREGAKFAG